MKGMSETIVIVITVVVILVAALVLLTIFGTGMANVTTISQAASICISSAQTSCLTTNTWPPSTWYSPTVKLNGNPISCNNAVTGCGSCDDLRAGKCVAVG